MVTIPLVEVGFKLEMFRRENKAVRNWFDSQRCLLRCEGRCELYFLGGCFWEESRGKNGFFRRRRLEVGEEPIIRWYREMV